MAKQWSFKQLKNKKQARQKPENELTAYHEAGHTVISIALGWPVESVTIVPRRMDASDPHLDKFANFSQDISFVSVGYTDVKYVPYPGDGTIGEMKHDKLYFLRWAISGLAGSMAEIWHQTDHLMNDRQASFGALVDYRELEATCVHVWGSAKAMDQIVKTTDIMIRFLWDFIEKVAKLLLSRGTLSKADIDEATSGMHHFNVSDEANDLQT